MQPCQPLLAALIVCAIGLSCGAAPAELKREEHPLMFAAAQLPVEGTLPSLAGAIEWLNTQPLTMTQLRGKTGLPRAQTSAPAWRIKLA